MMSSRPNYSLAAGPRFEIMQLSFLWSLAENIMIYRLLGFLFFIEDPYNVFNPIFSYHVCL